jgi:hypothetical protein
MMLSIDHRWGRRRVTDAAVRFMALPGTLGVGRITNVSVTGAFLKTGVALPLATIIHVESIEANAEATRKRLSASVVRCTEQGVGLEWCECASNSVLYAQFGSAYRDRSEFISTAPPDGGARPSLVYYQFDFKD